MKQNIQNLTVFLLLLFISQVEIISQNRDKWQEPERVMDSLDIKSGMIIGEVGAGEGYFTLKLSKRIGENGKIYANDIDEEALNKLKDKTKKKKLKNIEIVIGKENDPNFPVKNLDLVIMVYTFHHLDKPTEYVNNIIKYLKPGAQLILLEKDPDKHGGQYSHFYTKEKVLNKMSSSKFEIQKIMSFLERDHIYIYYAN